MFSGWSSAKFDNNGRSIRKEGRLRPSIYLKSEFYGYAAGVVKHYTGVVSGFFRGYAQFEHIIVRFASSPVDNFRICRRGEDVPIMQGLH